jgi:hypothetical protein
VIVCLGWLEPAFERETYYALAGVMGLRMRSADAVCM